MRAQYWTNILICFSWHYITFGEGQVLFLKQQGGMDGTEERKM